jgi:hypothetical protein
VKDHFNSDHDIHEAGIAAATGGLVPVALLITWTTSLVAYLPRGTGKTGCPEWIHHLDAFIVG